MMETKMEAPAQAPAVPLGRKDPCVIPLTVESINDFIDVMSVMHKWRITTPLIRTTFLCQAGTTTVATVNVLSGYACTRSHPLKIESDYYDRNIKVYVYVDSESNDLTYGGLSLTDEIVMTMGKFFVKRNYVRIKVVNDSSTDAYVTITFPCHMISLAVLDKVFIPLLRKACMDICSYIGVDPEKVE